MTRLTLALAATLALALPLALASPAFAQQAAIGIDEALVIVRANGMAVVAKLEHEHEKGVSKWEAEGLDAAGKKLEIEINAVDGKVISIK